MRPSRAASCAAVAFLAWLGLTCRPFWTFAASHPSAFGAWSLLHLLDVGALQPALAVLLLLGARGLGERLFGRALLAPLGEERPLFAVALGLGALAPLIAAAAAVAVNTPVVVALWAGLAVLAGAAPPLPLPRARALSGAEALSAVLLVLVALACWVQAAAPPISWDALSYHLEVPKRWLEMGRLGFHQSLYIAKNPVPLQAIYLLALGLGRDTLAQQFHLSFAFLCAAAVFLFAKARGGARWGALSAAVFACQPVFYLLASSANTDFALCFFGILSVWAFELWRERGARRLLVLSAALAGLACATKIVGLWQAAGLTAVLAAVLVSSRRGWRAAAADFGSWAIAGAACGLPWYLLNWHWFGDPVWPYFGRYFGDPAGQALYERLKASITEGYPTTAVDLVKLPYRLLVHDDAFTYGPHFLTVPLLVGGLWLAFRRRGARLPRAAAAFCVLYMLAWFYVSQSWRYVAMAMPFGCLVVGAALDDAWTAGRAPRAAAAAALAALGVFMLRGQWLSNELFALAAAKPSVPGVTWRDRYLGLSLQHYDLYRRVDAEVPVGERVMLYGEVRPYYLRHQSFCGDPLNDFRIHYAALETPEQLDARLRELGVSYIVVRPEPSAYIGDQAYYRHADALLGALLRERGRALFSVNGLTLYLLD